MFYTDRISKAFRMGDIIKGYSEILPIYNTNTSSSDSFEINLKIISHDYFVILTPCCSIEQKEAIIVPLRKINSNLLMSQYILENFLIINRPMKRREAMGDKTFASLSPEEQIEMENAPPAYEYLDKFIYNEHDIFNSYEIYKKRARDDEVRIVTNKYMICFKDAMKISCNLFERNNTNCRKILELSPLSRADLRNKLGKFYSRPAEEDKEFLI